MGVLDGRTAIVTGGGRGIGAACARALDAAGARVAIVARSEDQLAAVANTLANDPVVIAADLGTPDGPQTVADTALAAFHNRLDILVNNAAALLRKDTEDITADDIDHVLAVNVRAPLLLVTAVIPAMLATGSGSIVSISSVSGLRGTPRRQVYAASKAAIDGMTRSLAMEYGPRGVRANAVAPGVVATEMWLENLSKPGVEDAINGVTAMRRLTTVDELASVVTFLASDAASAITGEVIVADGGMNSTLNLWPTV